MASIKEQLESAKTPEKKVWTPPVGKVPESAVTANPEAPAPAAASPSPYQTLKGPSGHTATIIKQTDPAQKYAFLAKCTCQFEGRAKTQVDIETAVQRHFERYV